MLNYYKIIEIRNHGKEAARKWFLTNFEALQAASKKDDDITRFLALCGSEPPHKSIDRIALLSPDRARVADLVRRTFRSQFG